MDVWELIGVEARVRILQRKPDAMNRPLLTIAGGL